MKPLATLTAAALAVFVAGVAPAKPIACPEPIFHDESSMFRLGKPVFDDPAAVGQSISLGQRDRDAYRLAANAQGEVRVAANPGQTQGNPNVVVTLAPDAQPTLRELTDGVGLEAKLPAYARVTLTFVDAKDRPFRTPIHRQTTDGWEYLGTILNTVREFPNHNTRDAALPVKWTGLEIRFPDSTPSDQAIATLKGFQRLSRPIDGIPQRLAIDLADPPLGHVYQPGDTVRATFADPEGNATLRWKLTDYQGNVFDEGESNQRVNIEHKLEHPGHCEFVVTLHEDDERVDARVLGVAAMPDNPTAHDRMGISAHFSRWYYKLDVADLLPRIGVMNIRNGVAWQRVESQRNQYEMPEPFLNYLDLAEQRDIGGIFLASGHAKHFGGGIPDTKEETDAFVDYAVYSWNVAKGTMDDLMIWNEWSHGTGGYGDYERTPQGYVNLIEAIVPPIREQLPDVSIVGLGGENPYSYEKQIEAMLRTGVGKHFDSLAIHPYRQPYPPEVAHRPNAEPVDQTVRELLERSARYGGPARVDITEVGYPAFRPYWGVSETELARYVPRTLAMLHSVPEVHRVYWYNLRDMDEVPLRGVAQDRYSFAQHYYGVFRAETYNYAPKSAAVALATYTRMTADADYAELERLPNDVYRVNVMNRDGSPRCAILWTTGDPVDFPVQSSDARYVDIMGRTHSINDGRVTLSQDVVYLKANP